MQRFFLVKARNDDLAQRFGQALAEGAGATLKEVRTLAQGEKPAATPQATHLVTIE